MYVINSKYTVKGLFLLSYLTTESFENQNRTLPVDVKIQNKVKEVKP